MLIDSFHRQITYLRISLTDRCNLRCVYCMPAKGLSWIPNNQLVSDDEIIQVVQAAANLGITKIRLTGGEPLVRPGLVGLVRRIVSIPGIQDLSMTTNAILLEKNARPLAEAGLKRVNISLDTLKPERFQQITRMGTYERAWSGIIAAEQAALAPIKLNTVVMRGYNDDELPELAMLSIHHPWHVRFIEVMPIGETQDRGEVFPGQDTRYISVQEMHARLAELSLQPLDPPDRNGPARTYRIPGAQGTVGIISPLGENFCQGCNRLRLTADGILRSCLVMPGEVSIRDALRNHLPLEDYIRRAVAMKPRGHNLRVGYPAATSRGMSQIGG